DVPARDRDEQLRIGRIVDDRVLQESIFDTIPEDAEARDPALEEREQTLTAARGKGLDRRSIDDVVRGPGSALSLRFARRDLYPQRLQLDGPARSPDPEVERARRLDDESFGLFAIGYVAQDELETSNRHTRELESSFGVRDHAEAGAPDRHLRIGHRRAALRVFDDTGYHPRVLGVHRRGKREGLDE